MSHTKRDAEAQCNKAVAAMIEARSSSIAWIPYKPVKQPFPWGFTIGMTLIGVLILGWATLVSLGRAQETERLNSRGCERVYDPANPRLAGKIVDMSKEVWACKDGGIVYR